jgi:hypothetical protein
MGTKINSNYSDLLTFTRASKGHALRPVSYGTELVTNGGFDTDSDWILPSGFSISGGNLSYDGTAALYRKAYQALSTQAGKIYKLTFTLSGLSGSSIAFGLSQTNSATYLGYELYDEDGTYTLYVVADGTSCRVQIQNNSATQTFSVDNISVKEVLFDQPDGTLTLFEHPNNIPRVEWDADRNRLGLLVEEARTNLVTYSEAFENSAWTEGRLTVTSERIEGPDKVSDSGRKIEGTSEIGAHRLYSPVFNVTSGTTYTATVYMKKGEDDSPRLGLTDNTESGTLFLGANSTFDLTNGTADADGSIEDVGNGWYRCTLTGTAQSTSAARLFIYLNDKDTAAFNGQGFYIYGAQIEAGSFPTSYIKSNSGSTATRSADVASIPVADFGYNQSAGTLFVEARNSENCDVLALIDDGSSSNRIRLYESGSNVVGLVSTNSTNVAVMVTSQSVAVDGLKSAITAKKNDFAVVANGGSVLSDTAGDMPNNLTDLQVATPETGGATGAVHIKSIKYYPRRLTNAQLQALTEPRSDATLSLTFDGQESSFTENYIHG